MALLPAAGRVLSMPLRSALIFAGISLASLTPAPAQEGPIEPGEAYLTRFSGTRAAPGGPVIDTEGTVGSVIDIRSPEQPPLGQHWIDAPQRFPVTAGQVGQVFGVVLDDANPPNVYLAATSAFGLHRTANNAQWMAGLWGRGGGPGTIYKLDAASGYQPRVFSQVTLNGRPNTGPALGNIAYDPFNQQIFVSDLETGMIHRIRAADGVELGVFDHGLQGRGNFLDAETGSRRNLPTVGFDPNSGARIGDCPERFDRSPQCWNFAASGRRIWGLAVHRNPPRNEVRLYYSVWSGPAFDNTGWARAGEEDKRNAVWSVRLNADGGFAGEVRREFIVPDFFLKPQDIARAGYSQPVSDISFATCGPRPVMLVAERGGIRNLGLAQQNPFATPHEARALRYELDQNGVWRGVGRYDVGFVDRRNADEPFIHANCSGGAAFGYGYNTNNSMIDRGKADAFVWITGDYLCSPEGPCNLPDQEEQPPSEDPQQAADGESPLDDSEVHGLQGLAESAFEEIFPETARTRPSEQSAVDAEGLNQAYLIDADINVDREGGVIQQQLARNDATKIGDVAIYVACEPPRSYAGYYLTPGSTAPPAGYHFRYGSHSTYWSHSRFGSHNPFWSHSPSESHSRRISHWRYASHDRRMSHNRDGSHDRFRSHWRDASHDRRLSHLRIGSHERRASHARFGSHNREQSHNRTGSHSREQSHDRTGSHSRLESHNRTGSHNREQSHNRTGSHNREQSHNRTGSHSQQKSHSAKGSHGKQQSHNATGSHSREQSHNRTGSHSQQQSHNRTGSHSQQKSHSAKGSHGKQQSHNATGSHSREQSHNRTGSHSQQQSHNRTGSHDRERSHARTGSHSQQQSHNRLGSHGRTISQQQKGAPKEAPKQGRSTHHTPTSQMVRQ